MEIKDLKITTSKDELEENEGYVFISYSSDDSEQVFNEYVLPLQEKYGLRVFCDKDFQNRATQNWTTKMRENLEDAQVCIIFVSDTYVSSYACLLEVLVATYNKIPIIKVPLKKETVSKDNAEREISSSTVEQLKTIGKQLELGHFDDATLCYIDIAYYVSKEKISKNRVSKAFVKYLPKIEGDYILTNKLDCLQKIKNSIINAQKKDSFCKVAKAEQLDKAEVTELNKAKEEATVTRGVSYVLYGEKYTGNHTEIMCTTIKKVLEKHPELIDNAIEALSCLSNIDYSDKNISDKVPGYFKACSKIDVHGRSVFVGTNIVMDAKLKYVAKLLALVGENSDVLHIEGYELPDINLKRDGKCVSRDTTEKRSEEKYQISGVMKEGNQANMLWDVFEALANKYPEKVSELETMSNVSLAKDVTNPGTKESNPTCFMSYKSFMVNGNEYLVGAAYNRAEKIRRINKMLNICGAPNDFFVLEE